MLYRKLKELKAKLEKTEKNTGNVDAIGAMIDLEFPVWRCKSCGYLCSRSKHPAKCPICKITADRFEKILQ